MEYLIDRRAAAPGQPLATAGRLVIALHCSGGTPRQWRPLSARLGRETRLWAPSLHGAPEGPSWTRSRPFQLADEAVPILRVIDAHAGSVHLVGHSYGGTIALWIAARRATRRDRSLRA